MKLTEMLRHPEYVKIMKEKEKYFISFEAIEKIREFLELDGKNHEELRNIRNEIVLHFSELGDDEYIQRMDEFSALTGVMDDALWRVGVTP